MKNNFKKNPELIDKKLCNLMRSNTKNRKIY